MERQALAVEDEVVRRERHGAAAGDDEPLLLPHLRDDRVDRRHVHVLGRLSHEAEDDGLVAAVPAAGGPEAAEELGPDRRRASEDSRLLEVEGERARGPHRADGVRAAGADADLEEVENADRHLLRWYSTATSKAGLPDLLDSVLASDAPVGGSGGGRRRNVMYEEIKDVAGTALEKAKETAVDVKDAAGEALQSAGEAGRKQAKAAGHAASRAAKSTSKAVGRVVRKTRKAAGRAVRGAGKAGKRAARSARRGARKLASRARALTGRTRRRKPASRTKARTAKTRTAKTRTAKGRTAETGTKARTKGRKPAARRRR
jgi:hypothetical protein